MLLGKVTDSYIENKGSAARKGDASVTSKDHVDDATEPVKEIIDPWKEIRLRIYKRAFRFNIENSTVFNRGLDSECEIEDIEEAMKDLMHAVEENKRAMTRLRNEKDDEVIKMRTQHARDLDLALETAKSTLRESHSLDAKRQEIAWDERKSKLDKEILDLHETMRQIQEDQLHQAKIDAESHSQHIKSMEIQFQTEIEKMGRQHAQALVEKDDVIAQREKEILETQETCNETIVDAQEKVKNITQDYEACLRIERENAETSQRQHAKETKEINDSHAGEILNLKVDHEGAQKLWNSNHRQEIDVLERELSTVRQDHTNQIRQMTEFQKDTVEGIKRQHLLEHHNLSEKVENLKDRLIMGDRFKAMSDRELANLFEDLTDDVDVFARVPWAECCADTWFLTAKAFAKSGNAREDQQFLFQNTIWTILYEKIFRHPFQVLGDEGESLQQQWLAQFGGQGETLKLPISNLGAFS